MPLHPTDFDGRRRLKALRMSETEVDAMDRGRCYGQKIR